MFRWHQDTIFKFKCKNINCLYFGGGYTLREGKNKEMDVNEHILNISSYELSFFQELVLRRGLKFAFPQRVSST